MANPSTSKGYVVRHQTEVEPVPCPCGSSTRIITAADTSQASFHITHIKDAQRHYHKNTTEIYYILEGEGIMELGEDEIEVKPGSTVLIEKGTPHRACGDFKTVVVALPAFQADDEYLTA